MLYIIFKNNSGFYEGSKSIHGVYTDFEAADSAYDALKIGALDQAEMIEINTDGSWRPKFEVYGARRAWEKVKHFPGMQG